MILQSLLTAKTTCWIKFNFCKNIFNWETKRMRILKGEVSLWFRLEDATFLWQWRRRHFLLILDSLVFVRIHPFPWTVNVLWFPRKCPYFERFVFNLLLMGQLNFCCPFFIAEALTLFTHDPIMAVDLFFVSFWWSVGKFWTHNQNNECTITEISVTGLTTTLHSNVIWVVWSFLPAVTRLFFV